MDNRERMENLCRAVIRSRPVEEVPPWFAVRVMAHVRERGDRALDGWFAFRVAAPLMAGGGVLSAGFAILWAWLNATSVVNEWVVTMTAGHWLLL